MQDFCKGGQLSSTGEKGPALGPMVNNLDRGPKGGQTPWTPPPRLCRQEYLVGQKGGRPPGPPPPRLCRQEYHKPQINFDGEYRRAERMHRKNTIVKM